MTDTTSIDAAAFFDRYDRKTWRLMVTAISITAVLAAVIAIRLLTAGTRAKPIGAMWGLGVVFPLCLAVGWWVFTDFLTRRRFSAPDTGLPMNADDARNGMRIANAGFAFNVVLMVVVIAQQAFMGLLIFGYAVAPPIGYSFPRITMVAVGAVTIYLGNLWPRMPIARAPEAKPALRMKANRYAGWFMVIVGLLVLLWGLFAPHTPPPTRFAPPPFEASKHKEISLRQRRSTGSSVATTSATASRCP